MSGTTVQGTGKGTPFRWYGRMPIRPHKEYEVLGRLVLVGGGGRWPSKKRAATGRRWGLSPLLPSEKGRLSGHPFGTDPGAPPTSPPCGAC